jgi:serine/threonine protein kinase
VSRDSKEFRSGGANWRQHESSGALADAKKWIRVVHRDLKPGNLQLTDDGRLKILDFGLAKLRLPVTTSAVTESMTETQAVAGTLPYMAPEQLLAAERDARTDIHVAGSVLYEMATGHQSFAEVERSQLIGAILRRPPRPPTVLNPRLSPELARIIGKCLEKEPENRYQSAKELAVDLRRLASPTNVPREGRLERRSTSLLRRYCCNPRNSSPTRNNWSYCLVFDEQAPKASGRAHGRF